MCGIAGIYFRSERNFQELRSQIESMTNTISHRGPDGKDHWINSELTLALGHRRLSIVDLSDEGRQPKSSRSGNYIITFNGEIYNYIEIRTELVKNGINFKGSSDTEVLIEAIEFWGIKNALIRARGMFAIGVWDVRNRSLWLARDRVGKKPLYYFHDPNSFIFASEIKAILKVPSVKTTISNQSVSNFLSLGYVTGTDTIYKEISELEPGTILHVDLSAGENKKYRYWSFPNTADEKISQSEIIEQVEYRLNESIKLRLRADVPVGVFLSGGIDSGLITALAAAQSAVPLKTFTVSFGTSVFDESELARMVAKRYGTEHTEIRLNPDIKDLLPKVVRSFDEPFADPSAFPTYAISQEASKYVKVVLNGEGSDELFGGYRRIQAMRIIEKLQPVLSFLPGKTLSTITKLLPEPKTFRTKYSFLHRFARAAQLDPYLRYLVWSSDGFSTQDKKQLNFTSSTEILDAEEQLRERFSEYAAMKPLPQFMALDFLVGMTDCLLPKIDIATMAHGLEGRSPFLDQEFVYWVAGLNKNNLLKGTNSKPVLRAIAEKYLPKEIVYATKRGFELPIEQWMRHDLYDMVYDICASNNSILFDLFDRKKIFSILDRTQVKDFDRWSKKIWILFMLASWKLYIYDENTVCNTR
jgi:asparagine synthase (glutamine-hydrolysing)